MRNNLRVIIFLYVTSINFESRGNQILNQDLLELYGNEIIGIIAKIKSIAKSSKAIFILYKTPKSI
jgi:hypothetical protein